jgi:alanine racemase
VTETYRCWAEVDLNALRENLALIRELAGPGVKILTVVKADAYGHGLRQIAAVLMQSGTDVFGVANLAEAQAVRAVGAGWPILMLGACLPAETELAVRQDVMPTISTLEEAERFATTAAAQRKVVPMHLKIDTGMGRLGVLPEEAAALMDAVERLPGVIIQGLYTHYSSAEDDPQFTQAQRQRFEALLAALHKKGRRFEWVHSSSSSGLLLERDPLCNTVRPGLLVYGVLPHGRRRVTSPVAPRFRPALSWKCRVSLVREVPAGTPISYGRTFVTKRRTRLAAITAGYGDGYLRAASNRARVLIGGCACPLLGRVTMDQAMVDVSALPQTASGDEVVLVGRQAENQITVHQLAEWCGTVPWEILTNITYRVPRVYRGGHAA